MSDQPVIHIHNEGGGARWIGILATLVITGGLTALAYQLALSGFAEMAASAVTIFVVTLVSYCFKAGILRMPARADSEDDLAFTRSTLRRIYDEIQAAIAKSSVFRLVVFALVYTAGFMAIRWVAAVGLSALTSMWTAIGVGLLVGGAILLQSQILAWLRKAWTKKGTDPA